MSNALSTLSVDGLVPSSTRAFTDTVMTKFGLSNINAYDDQNVKLSDRKAYHAAPQITIFVLKRYLLFSFLCRVLGGFMSWYVYHEFKCM